jgi:hypothetical protein
LLLPNDAVHSLTCSPLCLNDMRYGLGSKAAMRALSDCVSCWDTEGHAPPDSGMLIDLQGLTPADAGGRRGSSLAVWGQGFESSTWRRTSSSVRYHLTIVRAGPAARRPRRSERERSLTARSAPSWLPRAIEAVDGAGAAVPRIPSRELLTKSILRVYS